MCSRKITIKQLVDFLKSKRDGSFPRHIATNLLNNPNHPIASKSEDEFSLKDIFQHIEVIDDPSPDRSSQEQ